jgi:hypothetical protein
VLPGAQAGSIVANGASPQHRNGTSSDQPRPRRITEHYGNVTDTAGVRRICVGLNTGVQNRQKSVSYPRKVGSLHRVTSWCIDPYSLAAGSC